MATLDLFYVYFRSFQIISRRKTVDFRGIQTRIDRVQGEHADHLTTTTALEFYLPIITWWLPNVQNEFELGQPLMHFIVN